MIGIQLANRYRLDSELGQGGMGIVYQAYDTLLDRQVAIKILSLASQARLGSQGRARLLHEAQAAARLNHTNIVSIFDAGEALLPGYPSTSPFIVMELLRGESLYEHKPDSLNEIIAIARQVCTALEHAHMHSIIHRDLKPENIIVEADGTVKLTDFGLARSAAISQPSSEGLQSSIVGTVYYLAPESALKQPVDERADLYSLGVILYEMVTGQLPFKAEDPLAVIAQHIHAPVNPPSNHRPDIPPLLEELILKLLSKQPQKRPATAGEVRLSLEALENAPKPGGVPGGNPLANLVRGRLVGRERELGEMLSLWRQAARGEGHTLIVSGEAGIGKTRLARELVALAVDSGGRALMGSCYPEGGVPYAPFNQVLQDLIRVPDGSLNLPDYLLADLIQLSPDLRLHFPDISPNPPLDIQTEQQHMFESVAAWMAWMAGRTPVVLFIDDVHWADSGTLFLLRTLARRAPHHHLLLVITYREDGLGEAGPLQNILYDLNRERLATRLKLTRLDRDHTYRILEGMLNPSGEIDPGLVDAIYRETEGNPFFIEEVTKALLEEGKLCFVDVCWKAQDPNDLEIPQSVRVAIQSRLARLPAETQDTLRLAAIIGRQFEFDILKEASDLAEEALIQALEIAERSQIIQEAPKSRAASPVFSFAHALIPSSLRDSLGGLRRQRMHRRVATALEKLRQETRCCYETLAYHFEQAGDAERAQKAYTLAGDQSLEVYANQEAERHYRAALELSRPDADRGRLHSGLGEALFRQSRYADAAKTWMEAIEWYLTLGDHDHVARLYARSARAAWYAGNTTMSLDLCREGMNAIQAIIGHPPGQVETHGMAALLHETARASHFNDLQEQALELGSQALAMARRLELVDIQADTLSTLGLLPNLPYEERQAALTQSVHLAESAGLHATAARAHINLGEFLHKAGDLPEARRHYLQARELAKRVGLAAWEHGFIGLAADLSLDLGEYSTVEAAIQAMRDLHHEIPDPGPAIFFTRLLEAHLARLRGEWETAVSLYRKCRDETQESGNRKNMAIVVIGLGETFLEMGLLGEAEALLRELVHRNEERGLTLQSATPLFLLSSAYLRQGQVVEGRQALHKARLYTGSHPSPRHQGLSEWGEGRLASAEKRWEQAFTAYDSLVKTTVRLSAPWYQAHGLVEWAEAHIDRGEAGDIKKATELLEAASNIYDRLAIPLYSERVGKLLQALRAEVSPKGI